VVRVHDAYTSSDARLITIVRKESIATASGLRKATEALPETAKSLDVQNETNVEAYDLMSRLFSRLRSCDVNVIASMAQKSDRILLWDAFTGGTISFEAAMFVAGTNTNTYSIHRKKDLHTGFGSGLTFLRGALRDGIQRTIVQAPKDSFNSISITLLAG
jgi:hypothetical protein